MKKRQFIFCISLLTSLCLTAQSNTFPDSGNVGIGTTTPSEKLHIAANNNQGILIGNYNDRLNWSGTGEQPGYQISFAGYRDIVPNIIGARISALRTNHCCNALDQGMELAFSVSKTAINGSNEELVEALRINSNGNIGIGTITPDAKLTVAGNIHAQEVKVTINAGADFVFDNDYKLPSLKDVEYYIKTNKHLPEIASEKDMQNNGLLLAEINIKLLQKIEELTLYTIDQEKRISTLESEKSKLKSQEKRIKQLEENITLLLNKN